MKKEFSISPWRKEVLLHSLLLSVLVPLVIFLFVTMVRLGLYNKLSDVSFLDFAFQARGQLRGDNRIVIINIGAVPARRGDIAKAIKVVKRCQPSVIGLDILLDQANGSTEDIRLSEAMEGAVPIVVPSGPDSSFPNSLFLHPNVYFGFADLRLGGDRVVRRFVSAYQHDSQWQPSFAAELAALAGEPIFSQFRPNKDYLINFVGNEQSFSHFHLSDIIEYGNLFRDKLPDEIISIFKRKIILFGYFADELTSYPILSDLYLTPITPLFSRSVTNGMYGVIIHANILNTMLTGRKIIEVKSYWGVGVAVVLVFANLFGRYSFLRIPRRRRRLIFLGVYLTELLVLLGFPIFVFYFFDIHVAVSVPLLSLLILPRAEGWYYRFVDNTGIPIRRLSLKKFPSFLSRPYIAVFEASLLRDRLNAALHIGSILRPFARFLLSDETAVPHSESRFMLRSGNARKSLQEALSHLENVLSRLGSLIILQSRLREAGKEFLLAHSSLDEKLDEPNFSDDSSSLPRRLTETSMAALPVREYDIRYENYFLELFSAVKRVVRELRPVLREARCEVVRAVTTSSSKDPRIYLVYKNGKMAELFPFVIVRRCQVHGEKELFVLSHEWQLDSEWEFDGSSYLGPQVGCFFLGKISSFENISTSQNEQHGREGHA
ncbi:MAG: CHASE2 domain-containing protein [Bacteroidota bacterium]